MKLERFGKGIATEVILIWAALMTLVIASLMVGHWISLPHPSAGQQLDSLARAAHENAVVSPSEDGASVIRTLKPDTNELTNCENSDFHVFHVLYGNCPCSRRVLNRLVQRKSITSVVEHIVLIGEDPEHQAQAIAVCFTHETVLWSAGLDSRSQINKRLCGFEILSLISA